MSADVYEIRSVADFLAVPAEKQAACLLDFGVWLEMVRAAVLLAADPEAGVRLESGSEMFAWIDDGKHIATVTLRCNGEILAAHELEFAPPEVASAGAPEKEEPKR